MDASPRIELHPNQFQAFLRPGTSREKRQGLLTAWYRDQLRTAAGPLIQRWQQALDVQMNSLYIQAMSRKWGSCNPITRNIRLNTQLAQKPKSCLDYVILHELCHLREPRHGEAFLALLNLHMADWKERRELLNRLPLAAA